MTDIRKCASFLLTIFFISMFGFHLKIKKSEKKKLEISSN